MFPAALLDIDTLEITPVSVEGQGAATILDIKKGNEKDYYLITSDFKTSNVYSVDKKNPKAGLQQVTHSPTLKLDLAVEPQTGEIAFTSHPTTATTSYISLLRSGTTTEETVGEGSTPSILKDGTFLVYEHNGHLVSRQIGVLHTFTLLDIPKQGTFALDPITETVALNDPRVQQLQHFSLEKHTYASAISTEKTDMAEEERLLVFVGKHALQLYSTTAGLALERSGKKERETIKNSTAYRSARVTPL